MATPDNFSSLSSLLYIQQDIQPTSSERRRSSQENTAPRPYSALLADAREATLSAARASALFRDLSIQQQVELISLSSVQRHLSRRAIIREGDLGLKVFLLTSGRVKITQVSRTGEEVILRILKSGDVVGGLGMRSSDMHSTSATTLESCEVVLWDTERFESFFDQFPALRRNALHIVKDSLQVLEECFCDLATHRVAPRLARTVLRLSEQHRAPVITPISLTCEELGQMTGTTLFTVSRVLCSWAERGLIEPEHRTITIKDLQGLIAIAEGQEAA